MATRADPYDPIHEFETDDTIEGVVGDEDTVIVDFFATWCGPCKQLKPVLEAIVDTTDARVVKVDVDQHQALAAEHQVRGVPTLLVFHDGELVERLVGYQPEPQLRELVDGLAA